MTQVYTPAGVLVPVTVIELGPCTVVATRRAGARRLRRPRSSGFGRAKAETLTKPLRGQFKKAGTGGVPGAARVPASRATSRRRSAPSSRVAEVFAAGERVQVTGISKGRGTAGVMKRHGFAGFPASHGTHEYFRHGGSIGNRSFPGRVLKGKRMAGRLGAERVTTRNLEVVAVRPDEHLILVRGRGARRAQRHGHRPAKPRARGQGAASQ